VIFVVVVRLIVRDVDLLFCLTLGDDRFDQKSRRPDVELIIEREAFRVVGEDDVLRAVTSRRNVSQAEIARRTRRTDRRIGTPERLDS
jgi:hypothetical protein